MQINQQMASRESNGVCKASEPFPSIHSKSSSHDHNPHGGSITNSTLDDYPTAAPAPTMCGDYSSETMCSASATTAAGVRSITALATMEEISGRERLKRLRVEVSGQVWIPEIWGQEDFLKDWIDCTAFHDASLMSIGHIARASLAEEGRRRS